MRSENVIVRTPGTQKDYEYLLIKAIDNFVYGDKAAEIAAEMKKIIERGSQTMGYNLREDLLRCIQDESIASFAMLEAAYRINKDIVDGKTLRERDAEIIESYLRQVTVRHTRFETLLEQIKRAAREYLNDRTLDKHKKDH